MSQLPEAFEEMLSRVERDGDGWLSAKDVPGKVRVLLDGYTMDYVISANRKEGVVKVAVKPLLVTHRNGEPEVLTYKLRGNVELAAW